jgi:hypothetical protein
VAAIEVEQWGIFNLELTGPSDGNPFADVAFACTFSQDSVATHVDGFYDGDGTYRVRFMPATTGKLNRPGFPGDRFM